jgi:serine/threonine-protein kinase HipA
MTENDRNIGVWTQWFGMDRPEYIGALRATAVRGKEVFSFEYNEGWLNSPFARVLDPTLDLFRGRQFAADERRNFGVFLDSAPDRWGRLLMRRREAQFAREQGRAERKLRETDFLLGVFDGQRMGALRFKLDPGGSFLDDNRSLASPAWTSLRELEAASLALEHEGAEDKKDYAKWIRMLVAPGGSLGGARPKAGVVGKQKDLWIAKFPSRQDEVDVGAWEMVVHILADRAGVDVAPAHVRRFKGAHHTFLTKRFDRDEFGARIHFSSAMTMLRKSDGDDASAGVSYLNLAKVLIQQGSQPRKDLEELWLRILFFVCVSNVDDHLRNHGFLLEPGGWRLAPAYDMNPVPHGDGLKLNISDTDNSQDLDLVRGVAAAFRITTRKSGEMIQQVIHAVRTWPEVATSIGIGKREQRKLAEAFRLVM